MRVKIDGAGVPAARSLMPTSTRLTTSGPPESPPPSATELESAHMSDGAHQVPQKAAQLALLWIVVVPAVETMPAPLVGVVSPQP